MLPFRAPIILAIAASVALVACGDATDEKTADANTQPAVTITTTDPVAPVTDPAPAPISAAVVPAVVEVAPPAAPAADAPPSPPDPALAAKSQACFVCHAVGKPGVLGPDYKEVAKKYSKADVANLADKVVKGGGGAWTNSPACNGGCKTPMTPNAVTPDEAKALVEWILTLK